MHNCGDIRNKACIFMESTDWASLGRKFAVNMAIVGVLYASPKIGSFISSMLKRISSSANNVLRNQQTEVAIQSNSSSRWDNCSRPISKNLWITYLGLSILFPNMEINCLGRVSDKLLLAIFLTTFIDVAEAILAPENVANRVDSAEEATMISNSERASMPPAAQALYDRIRKKISERQALSRATMRERLRGPINLHIAQGALSEQGAAPPIASASPTTSNGRPSLEDGLTFALNWRQELTEQLSDISKVQEIDPMFCNDPVFERQKCTITNKPIRFIVTPKGSCDVDDEPVFYEKAAIETWIRTKPTQSPPGWPVHRLPLALSTENIEACRVLQIEIDQSLKKALRDAIEEAGEIIKGYQRTQNLQTAV